MAGLYSNIHAKRKRIAKQKATGAKKVEKMRKPGSAGAPSANAFKQSAKTAKRKQRCQWEKVHMDLKLGDLLQKSQLKSQW